MKKTLFVLATLAFIILPAIRGECQMITGVWKGKINRQRVEVKIIQDGDQITGTSYYFESPTSYRRYSIRGYFDVNTNEVVWWDDQLLDEKSGRFSITSPGRVPLLSRADFNCPGDGRMMLDGAASQVENENKKAGDVHLDKTGMAQFPDEWDFVIDNYTTGANDHDLIDSIGAMASIKIESNPEPWAKEENPVPHSPSDNETRTPKPISAPPITKEIIQESKPTVQAEPKPISIQEKFTSRKKVFATEIPIAGDSIELRFYDNAQVDGDSISLFLNDRLIFEHIRLTDKAYTVKLPVQELGSSNELIMVAENLGSIPPNTSYMVAIVEEKRYEARLESTEGSSALIRLVRR